MLYSLRYARILTGFLLCLSVLTTLASQSARAEAAIRYETTGVVDLIIGRLYAVNLVEMFADDNTKYYNTAGKQIVDTAIKEGMIVKAVYDYDPNADENTIVSLTQVETTNIIITRQGAITEYETYVLVLDDTLRVGYNQFDTKIYNKAGKLIPSDSLSTGLVVRATGTRTSTGLYATRIDVISDGTGYQFTFTDYVRAVGGGKLTLGEQVLTLPQSVWITLGKTRRIPQTALQKQLLVSAKATKLADKTYRIDSLFLGQLLGLLLVQEVDATHLVAEDMSFPIISTTKVYMSDGSPASVSDITPGSFVAAYSLEPADFGDPNTWYRIGVIVIEQADFKFVLRGTVEEKGDSTLTVHGFTVGTNVGTKVYRGVLNTPGTLDNIVEGGYVEMLVQRIFADKQFLALEISVADEINETAFEYGGVVDSVKPNSLVINGIEIETTTETVIVDKDDRRIKLADIQPSFFAFASGVSLDDGRNIAKVVRIITDPYLEYNASGPITAIDGQTVSIGSLKLPVSTETELANFSSVSDLQIGDFIRIMYYYLPDKSIKAIRIERLEGTEHLVRLNGRIDSLFANGFSASGLRFTVNDSTELSDEYGQPIDFDALRPNFSVVVEGVWQQGGDITATFVMQRRVMFLRAVYRSSQGAKALIGNQEYVVDSTTTIIDVDGKPIRFDQLIPGSVVEVTASSTVNGVRTAERIQVQKRGTGSTGVTGASAAVAASVTPNPIMEFATISYITERESNVNISVTGIDGRTIATISDGIVPAGNHTIQWNAAELPAGAYFIIIRAGGRPVTLPVRVVGQ